MKLPLFRTRSKRLTLLALVAALAAAAVWKVAHSESDSVDAATKAKAEKLRSEILDYTPPETNVPDTTDLPPPTKLQPSTRKPKPGN